MAKRFQVILPVGDLEEPVGKSGWDGDGPTCPQLVESTLGIAFVGTYPPRRCGIASFTRDLSRAVAAAGPRVTPITLAITDPSGQYEYPQDVMYEIRQGVKADYARAAEFVNYSDVRAVSI